MSEKAPRPERQSKSLALIETNQREPRTIPTPYGEFAFVCHKGEAFSKRSRAEQQDACVAVIDEQASPARVNIAVVDGITGRTKPSEGKEASLFVAAELKNKFLTGNLNNLAEDSQRAMQTFGVQHGGAAFAALELESQRVTWAGDVRIVIIYPDNTPPFTTLDHVNPDSHKRNELTRYIGAADTYKPETAVIDPPIVPGCKIVIMTDGAYKNLDLDVEFIDEDIYDPITDDATTLEETEETRDAKTLAALLRPHATPAEAIHALNDQISKSPSYSDNITLAILYVDKKIPLGQHAQEDQELIPK